MGFEFARPLSLLALIPALALVAAIRRPWWQEARRAGRAAWRRERRVLIRRGLWVFLLVLALAGPSLRWPLHRQAVVLVVDSSASVAGVQDQAEDWVRRALAALPEGDRAGVVAVAAAAQVEEPPTERPVFSQLAAQLPRDGTDLAAGLELAGAILPEGYAGRVVALTDGRFEPAEALPAARTLAARGVPVDVAPLGPPAVAEARLEAVDLPEVAYTGEESILSARIRSDQTLAAVLRVYQDGALVAQRELDLTPGAWTVRVPVPVGGPGLHRYEVRLDPLDPAADPVARNNRLGAVQRVQGPPRVLILISQPPEAQPLQAALEAAGAWVEVREPAGAPADLTGWARYQAVVLAGVPVQELPPAAPAQLEQYVRDLGRGLVMTGSPRSFGLGGYGGTPVERALPVYMDISGRGRIPQVALAVVMDKSGSMGDAAGGAAKMELAKEAAVRSVELLRPRDQVAVLAFDSAVREVVPLGPVAGRDLRTAIGRITASGGTDIYPALLQAYRLLAEAEADRRHVILLTDGRSAVGGEYAALTAAMAKAEITLSTVAVGSGADTLLLEALARAGGGRYYFTADPNSIPEIFAQETTLATRTMVVQGRFYPALASSGPLAQGMTVVPPLEGYVAATPKERAEVVLVSHQGDPVLAAWQYGLGRSLAWTSDLGERWARPWVESPRFAALWSRALAWLLPGSEAGALQVQAEATADGRVVITAETPGQYEEVRRTRGVILGPSGERQEVDLQPAGPGLYQAVLPAAAAGAYLVAVEQERPGQPPLRAETGWVTPYPTEYRALGVNQNALQRLAAAGGGRILSDPEEAMAPPPAPVPARLPLAPVLLVLAALAWPLEIAGRRLILTAQDRERLVSWLRRRLLLRREGAGKAPAPARTEEGLARLQAARQRVRHRHTLQRAGEKPAATPSGHRPEGAPTDANMEAAHTEDAPGKVPASPAPPDASTAPGSDPTATARQLLRSKRNWQARRTGSGPGRGSGSGHE